MIISNADLTLMVIVIDIIIIIIGAKLIWKYVPAHDCRGCYADLDFLMSSGGRK